MIFFEYNEMLAGLVIFFLLQSGRWRICFHTAISSFGVEVIVVL